MRNLTNKQLVLIKKCIAAGCALLCTVFILLNIFTYTSSTEMFDGTEYLTWSDGFSMFNFLFNGKANVLDNNVYFIREMFGFSYVIIWISFILLIISLGILIYGIFNKKSLFSKIGSMSLLVSFSILILVNFNTVSLGKTVIYLSVFNVFYLIQVLLCGISVFSTFTIKEK